ncbi:MAG: 5-formyltetrahydrofolate cyclo-ligase [Candidatus Omnitrophica bacterium]|nr:5-formyltetrahydrofolate cyclo-ligase [Candidatus Omnitrophota bacterium]
MNQIGVFPSLLDRRPSGWAGTRQPEGVSVDKRQLRIRLLGRLKAQTEEERRRKSEAIHRRLFRLKVFQTARTVLCYVSLSYEVETRRLIEQMQAMGKRVVVPRVEGRQLGLSRLADPSEDLARGAFGVLEPKPDAVRPVSVEALDLVLVPGLAFDRRGHRLGHGHGYFDRLLARLPDTSATVGLCFAFQLLDRLPVDPHDRSVQTVLSA